MGRLDERSRLDSSPGRLDERSRSDGSPRRLDERSRLDSSQVDSTSGATRTCHSPPPVQADLTLQYNDRAPSFERPVLRSLPGTCSSQVLPRHTRGSPYRCSLPGLAGFDDSRCVGPNLQRRPAKLTQHDPPSRGNSTPLKRIAGYRAPLTPRLARPSRTQLAEGPGFEPGAQGLPVHGISSAAPSAARSPLLVSGSSELRRRSWKKLAEGRGFEPPRDLLGPYPISSRTPSTGLGHPSAQFAQ